MQRVPTPAEGPGAGSRTTPAPHATVIARSPTTRQSAFNSRTPPESATAPPALCTCSEDNLASSSPVLARSVDLSALNSDCHIVGLLAMTMSSLVSPVPICTPTLAHPTPAHTPATPATQPSASCGPATPASTRQTRVRSESQSPARSTPGTAQCRVPAHQPPQTKR